MKLCRKCNEEMIDYHGNAKYHVDCTPRKPKGTTTTYHRVCRNPDCNLEFTTTNHLQFYHTVKCGKAQSNKKKSAEASRRLAEDKKRAIQRYKRINLDTTKDTTKLLPLRVIFGSKAGVISAGIRQITGTDMPKSVNKIKHRTKGVINKTVSLVSLELIAKVIKAREEYYIKTCSTGTKSSLNDWVKYYRKLEEEI